MQLDYKNISFNTEWILSGSDSIIYKESILSTLNIALDKKYQINDARKVVITDNQISGKGTHGAQIDKLREEVLMVNNGFQLHIKI